MYRINVMSRPDEFDYDGPALAGWFDRDSADCFDEGKRWDGNNHVGVISGLQVGYECLYRTKGGRWVRYYDASNEFSGPEYYEFITDAAAREWLLRADEDEAVEKYFGKIEEEKGPGRPAIGPASSVKLGADLTEWLDRRAGEWGVSRAELIRQATVRFLNETEGAPRS